MIFCNVSKRWNQHKIHDRINVSPVSKCRQKLHEIVMRKKGTYRNVICCKLSINETKRDSKRASELHRYYRPRKRICRSLIQFYPVWLLHFPQWKTEFLRIILSVKIGFNRDILGVSNIRLLQSLLIVSMIPLFSDKRRKLNKWKIHRAVRTMKFTWCMHDSRVLQNSLP